jgi:hypothetical protein
VTITDFYKTLTHFLTERFDKNIINIIQKARQKRSFMLRLLFNDDPVPFTVHDPDIGFLYANGVVENVDGWVDISVPLYKKCLLSAFRPTINGETEYYVSAQDTFSEYLDDSGLNVRAILQRYVEYVAKRCFRAFDAKHLREGAWHYVVFSRKHTTADVLEQEEVIDGKRIFTRIIRVKFERPSRSRKKRKK